MTSEETLEKLKDKLLEETEEMFEVYMADDTTKYVEEIADIIEVLNAMLYHRGHTLDEVEKIRAIKKEKRGGFETGLFLESIDYFDEHP